MIRPDSAPIRIISHELDCCSSSPYTVCPRRSKTKYWPNADCWKPATSRNRPATCVGTAFDERITSDWMAVRVAATRQQPPRVHRTRRNILARRSQRSPQSVSGRFANGLQDVGRLRKDGLLEIWAVGDRRVASADASDGRVEMFEQLAGDPRS